MREHSVNLTGRGKAHLGERYVIPLVETTPGVYEAWWTVPADMLPGRYGVVGRFTANGETTTTAMAPLLVRPALPPFVQEKTWSRHGLTEWYARALSVVPQAIGEPWLGDVKEERLQMFGEGRSRLSVEGWTLCQTVHLFIQAAWGAMLGRFHGAD